MLHVERSNRIERLFDGLADRVGAPGRDPLQPTTIVVQGPGMERWLAQSLALRFDVCANTEFLFPREFLERVFAAGGAKPEVQPWSTGPLTWAIARILTEEGEDPDYAPLALHLDAPDADWRRIQLAGRVAALFDRYATFRPEWMLAWGRSETLPEARDARWQARLVRRLTEEWGEGHFAARALDYLESPAETAGLPAAVEIFAVSTLPPVVLSVVDRLARRIDVSLSILTPSRAWWADVWREVRDADRAGMAAVAPELEPEAPGLFDAGPPNPATRLLAGLGRLGSDFQRCLEDDRLAVDREIDRYDVPEGESLLARIQRALLDLDRLPASERSVAEDDDSITVQVCHGPRRELEVLQATLREAFERDDSLRPEDVIVMAPQIDAIAPDIEAIFGTPGEGLRIPHRIADRGTLRRSPVADAFAALLELVTGRAGRSELLGFLARPPVRRRFELDAEAVDRLAEWTTEAGIRFGLDRAHREALELPGATSHTWSGALDRMALAHAVGATDALYAGVAAAPIDPRLPPEALGSLGDWVDFLETARREAAIPRPVSAWAERLEAWLAGACAQTDDDAHEHLAVRTLLQKMTEDAEVGGHTTPVPFEAIRERFLDAQAASPAPQAFLAGGVTFCELVPLRAIPFRIIAILGLSETAFPRGGPVAGFDLAAREPQPGDRDLRTDDRYLFLEALVSARDRLLLSVPGRDLRDGRPLPASTVVTELLDVIEQGFDAASGEPLRAQLVTEHPLHGWSPLYFEPGSRLQRPGTDAASFRAAQARRLAEVDPPTRTFVSGGLAAEEEEGVRTVDLDGLVAQLVRGARAFVRDTLQIRLPRSESATSELDPVGLDPLGEFQLGDAMLREIEAGRPAEEVVERVRSSTMLPAGIPGESVFASLRDEVLELAALSTRLRDGAAAVDLDRTLEFDLPTAGLVRLRGRLAGLTSQGRIVSGYRMRSAAAELDLWIRHLFLCACDPSSEGVALRSVLVGRLEKNSRRQEPVTVFAAVDDAHARLAELLEWALVGERIPQPFFPATARDFVEAADSGEATAWRKAHQTFSGGDDGGGRQPERQRERETELLWEGIQPIGTRPPVAGAASFDVLARGIFGPLLAARSRSLDE